jgi:hypothetical protein
MLNATRRDSLIDPVALVPGEIVTLAFDVDATGWMFAQGHRVRIAIANADWPNIWPTPELAVSSVFRGPSYSSRLELPVVPQAGSAVVPEFAESPLSAETAADYVVPPVWDVTTDLLTGRVRVQIGGSGESRVNPTTVVHRAYSVAATVDPADPASASARGEYSRKIVRPNSTVEGVSDVLVQASREHFHVSVDLELRVNGRVRHTRSWIKTIPRVLL